MKKSTAALAGLITAAGLTGAAATAQAHPAHVQEQTAAHQTSRVALTRLHQMLQTPAPVAERGTRPNDSGAPHF